MEPVPDRSRNGPGAVPRDVVRSTALVSASGALRLVEASHGDRDHPLTAVLCPGDNGDRQTICARPRSDGKDAASAPAPGEQRPWWVVGRAGVVLTRI